MKVGGLGAALASAAAKLVQENGGAAALDERAGAILYDEQGRACGIATAGGEEVAFRMWNALHSMRP